MEGERNKKKKQRRHTKKECKKGAGVLFDVWEMNKQIWKITTNEFVIRFTFRYYLFK